MAPEILVKGAAGGSQAISGDTFDQPKGGVKKLAALPIRFAPSRATARRLWRTSSEPTRQSSAVFRPQPESAMAVSAFVWNESPQRSGVSLSRVLRRKLRPRGRS
jgi:hypothetical protein